MRKILKRTVSALLAASVMLFSFASCKKEDTESTGNDILDSAKTQKEYVQQEYTTIKKKFKKDETVYVNTKPDGSIYQVKVTDWIHTDAPQVRVLDKSNLDDIVNVKSLTKPVYKNGNLFWDMDTTDLYYSGTTKKQPPVSFTISYYLNGKKLSPDEIAGKKGDVKIEINVKNSLTKKVKVEGKTYTITCPMLVVGGTILPESNFSDIAIDYGTTVSDGAKQVVFFAGIPGIDESLGLSDLNLTMVEKGMYTSKYTITAHTENFELGNIMFAAVPLTAVAVGNGGLSQSIDSIQDVLNDVEKIQKALGGMNIDEIISLLYSDSNKIENMLGAVTKASRIYAKNEKLLKVLGKNMTDENLKKLDKLVTDLEKADIDAINKTISDPAMKKLLQLLPLLSESLSDISILAEDLEAVMPMFQKLSAEMQDPEIQKSLKNLPQTLNDLKDIINVLQENKKLLDAVSGIVSGEGAKQIEAILSTADKYISSAPMDEAQAQTLAGRVRLWAEFGSSYDIFSSKTEDTNSTVIFTYKTDALKKANEKKDNKADEKETEDNKFIAFFKNIFS